MRLRSIRVAAIHELPLQCVFLHQSYKAHLQTEMVLRNADIVIATETECREAITGSGVIRYRS